MVAQVTFDEMRAALDTLTGLKFQPADYKTHWRGLQDMPIEALWMAVERAARECREFPSPVELRALAPRERGCRYGHVPACDSWSDCTRKMLAEKRTG